MIQHLACIMDGNRRWAQQHELAMMLGGQEGLQRIGMVIQFCLERRISYLSLYAFALENFKRPQHEQDCYFNLILSHGKEQAAQMRQKGVRVRFVGNRALFPAHVIPMIEYIESETANGEALNLNFLFCYGGRQEILAALPALMRDVQQGIVTFETMQPDDFKKYMWSGDIPDPDLIIRTGFVHRLSGMFSYQSAYSELYFADCLWPDITEKILEDAVQFFKGTKRNFGR